MTRTHFHLDDYPQALAVLAALLAHRPDTAALGYEATEHGAWVEWDTLARGKLSSTEIATVHLAHGISIAERHHGLPPKVVHAVREAIATITS